MHEVSESKRQKTRAELINGNLRLVLSLTQCFTNRGENLGDLFQFGCIRLIKAIDNFDFKEASSTSAETQLK